MASRAGGSTRADVARAAGTSVAVVSYVVNNGPRPVAADTRQRVLEAIAATRYRPNAVAKALAAGSTRMYGLVVPDISNPYFAALAHAVEDEMFAAGRVLLLGNASERPEREIDILTGLQQQRVDGVLLVGLEDGAPTAALLEAGVPVVVLDRTGGDDSSASVSIDNVAAAATATRHLVEHGYATIGMIGGTHALSVSRDRLAGFASAMRDADRDPDAAWTAAAGFSKAAGFELGRRWFAGSQPLPRALFVAGDQQAIGLLRAAAEAGVRVPEDLAIAAFDGTEDSAYCVPPLTTIRQPVEELARAAVAMLLAPGASATHVTCDHELVVRRSCGCPPAAADAA